MPALQFIHSSYERRQCSSLDIAGGHFLRLRAAALALRGPPLQMKLSHHRRKAAVDTHKIGLVQWLFVFTGEDTTMYAVIRSGGKQYRVSPGQTIRLEKFAGDVGSKVEIKDVLLVENDGSIQLGTPVIANVTVEGTVIEQDRMKKIIVFKKKRKKQYRRTQGHRQDYTAVRIDKITV